MVTKSIERTNTKQFDYKDAPRGGGPKKSGRSFLMISISVPRQGI